MRLITGLTTRLLDAECGYAELERGLSAQEEQVRLLREQVNRQWVLIDKYVEQIEKVGAPRDEEEALLDLRDQLEKELLLVYRELGDARQGAADYWEAWQNAQREVMDWRRRANCLEVSN